MIPMLVIFSMVLPVLVRVTVCDALGVFTGRLPNGRVVEEKPTAGAEGLGVVPVPVPESLIVWGLGLALSATLRVAFRLPLALGLKVIRIVHAAPAASVLWQVLVCAKSLALVPVIATEVMLKALVPVLLRVAVCPPLLLPMATLPNEKLPG